MSTLRAWLSGVLRGCGHGERKELDVEVLLTPEDLDAALDSSDSQPIALFKHSTRCPVSSAAHRQVMQFLEKHGGEGHVRFYLVKVIESRPVSNAIAERLGVPHQSPQVILVNCKRAYWVESHGRITVAALEKASQ